MRGPLLPAMEAKRARRSVQGTPGRACHRCRKICRVLRSFVVVLILVYPLSALGNECFEQDYDSEEAPDFGCPGPGESSFSADLNPQPSVPLVRGESFTPSWDGAFVHADRLIDIGLKLRAVRRLRWLDRVRMTEEYQLRLEHERRVAEVSMRHATKRLDQYKRALDQANERTGRAQAWYRSWPFGFLVGVVATGLAVGLGVYLGLTV